MVVVTHRSLIEPSIYGAFMEKMHNIQSIIYTEVFVYPFLFISTIFINKYVLSILNFTYPTVFQAWQTLVGAVIFKYLNMKTMMEVNELDRYSAMQMMPYCIFYVGGIVAGSKALSKLPVAVFVTAGSLPGACVFLLDYASATVRASMLQLTAGLVSLFAVVAVIFLDITLPFADSAYSWLLLHVVFETTQVLYGRITDGRWKETDKLYYRSIFSVIVLAPASLYLEEAFLALHFQHRRQLRFYAGCLCSGVLGACLQLSVARTPPAPRVAAPTRIAACFLAVPVFGNYSPISLLTAATGLTAATLLPHTDEIEANGKHSDPSTV